MSVRVSNNLTTVFYRFPESLEANTAIVSLIKTDNFFQVILNSLIYVTLMLSWLNAVK
jgi:hypothetical protein